MTLEKKDPNSKSYSSLLTPQLYGLYGQNDHILEEEEDRYMVIVDNYLKLKGYNPQEYIQDQSSNKESLPSVKEMEKYINERTGDGTDSSLEQSLQNAATLNEKSHTHYKRSIKNSIIDEYTNSNNFTFKKVLKSVVVLGLVGMLYNRILNEFYNKDMLIHPFLEIVLKPFLEHNSILVSGLIGVFLGLMLNIMDFFLYNQKKNDQHNDESLTTLIKLSNSILGMFLVFKKIEIQDDRNTSIIWFLLNILIWLLFDGTKSLLFTGCLFGLLFNIFNNSDFSTSPSISLMIFNINFVFNTVLIFGKLSRYLKQ